MRPFLILQFVLLGLLFVLLPLGLGFGVAIGELAESPARVIALVFLALGACAFTLAVGIGLRKRWGKTGGQIFCGVLSAALAWNWLASTGGSPAVIAVTICYLLALAGLLHKKG